LKKLLSIILLFQCTLLHAQLTEKLFLHTDKSSYHAGEILWLKADVVDGTSLPSNGVSRVVYAELLDNAGHPLLQLKIGLNNGSGSGSLEIPAIMHNGKYILTAYTAWMKNFSPDNYFYKEIIVINNNDSGVVFAAAKMPILKRTVQKIDPLIISLSTDKNNYSTRDKITVNVSAPALSKLSVSVYKIDSFQQAVGQGIAQSLAFTPDTVQLRRTIVIPEIFGHIITGKIIDSRSGKPASGITGYLSVPGKKQFNQVSTSDSSGRIIFEEKDFYGVDEIVMQTNILTDSMYYIELDDPFSVQHALPGKDSINIAVINSRDRTAQGVSAMVQELYAGDTRKKIINISTDTLAFYGRPAANYKIDDYVKFTNMEDVLREYVTQVGVQKRKGKLFPFVYDQLRRKPFANSPLYFVDAVPVFEVDRIMSMDPLTIGSIEVVDGKFFRGEKTFEGIVSISTKKMNVELERNAKMINYSGLLPVRQFNSPVYATAEQRSDRLPDFRNVLYWAPEIITSDKQQQIEFYSSDIKGTYAVRVQGISANGEVGSEVITFKVE
jgi:hypothetical protein